MTKTKRTQGNVPSPAAKAATTRRRNRACARGADYGALLYELWRADEASKQAGSRAANLVDHRALRLDERNYRTSSYARERPRREGGPPQGCLRPARRAAMAQMGLETGSA